MGFPTELREAAHAVLVAAVAAHPEWQVTTTSSARPASAYPMHLWVDDARFDLAADSGTRQWRCEVDVWVCYQAGDNEDGQARADVALSGLLDAFDADPHWPDPDGVGNRVHEGTVRVRTGTVAVNAIEMPAYVVTLGDIYLQEGR